MLATIWPASQRCSPLVSSVSGPSLDPADRRREHFGRKPRLWARWRELAKRLDELLDHFARDRANELTEKLSGGLRRRVELARNGASAAIAALDELNGSRSGGAERFVAIPI